MNLADMLRNSPLRRQRLDERKWDSNRMSYDAHRMRDVPFIGKALQFYDDVTGPEAWSRSSPALNDDVRQAIDNTPKAELMEGLGNYLPAMDTGGLAGMLKKMPLSKKKWYGGKDPMQLTENEFIKTHKTGTIPIGAYDETDWWGTEIKANPQLIKTIDIPQGQVEFRKSGIKNSYTKMIGDGPNEKVARGDDGLALSLSDSEIKAKGLPVEDQTITAFFNGEPIGHASNEFGSVGVFLNPKGPRRFHGDSIGTELLTEFMKENPHMQMGRMTHSGERTARKAHKKLTNMMRGEQGSRQGGKGASNFVSFTDDIAKILERNDQPIGDLAKGLDESLRMGRAKDMGFDVDKTWYRGTDKDYKRSKKDSFYSSDPEFAEQFTYGTGPIAPVYAKGKIFNANNQDEVSAVLAKMDELNAHAKANPYTDAVSYYPYARDVLEGGVARGDAHKIEQEIVQQALKELGYDGTKLMEGGVENLMMFNPKNIRSKFAKFDPRKKNSANVLAGAGAGFLASQLMGQDPNERF